MIVLNNKSNLNKYEYIEYLKELTKLSSKEEIVLCPSIINIGLSENLNSIKLGAQNVSASKNGAHTGEVSAEQLLSYGVRYTLVGHSERRQEQKETTETFERKINNLLEENIIPIYCIGETKEEKDLGKIEEVLTKELDILKGKSNNIIIAYEPIWSIGTGLIPSNEEIEKNIQLIKKHFPDNKVLYGGSVNEENIDQLKKINIIDGYLIGGLSLKVDKLEQLLYKL